MAVCDLDANRVEDGKKYVNDFYAKKTGKPYNGVTGYADYLRAARQQGRRRRRHQHARSLARAHRHRRGGARQGRLPAEAGVADHCRGARREQRRPPVRADFPDRQPAAVDHPVPVRGRAGAQRAHRPAQDRGGRAARRSVRRGRARDAGPEGLQLRDVARLDAARVLHREARASAGRLRPARAGCGASSSAPA